MLFATHFLLGPLALKEPVALVLKLAPEKRVAPQAETAPVGSKPTKTNYDTNLYYSMLKYILVY